MDINIRWISEDDSLVNSFENIEEKIEDISEEFEDLNKKQGETFSKMSKDSTTLQKSMDKSVQSVKGLDKGLKGVNSTGATFRKWLSDGVRSIDLFGVNIGETVDKLKSKQTALRGVVNGLGGASKGFKALKLAIAATGIGLIVIAFTSLAALLTKTQKGMDAIARVSAVLSSVFDNVTERAVQLGQTLFDFFTGNLNFSEAVDKTKDSFAGLTKEIIEDAKATDRLTVARQQLIGVERDLRVELSKRRAEIEKLRIIADDESKSFIERQNAIQKAIELETDLENKRVSVARENLRIITEKNKLGISNNDALEEEALAQIELNDIIEDSNSKRAADILTLQGLRKDAAAQRQKQLDDEAKILKELEDDYNSLFQTINEQRQSARIGNLTGVDRLQAEREIAVEEVNKLKEQLKTAAEALGKDVDADAIASDLLAEINKAFEKEVNDLRNESFLLSELPSVIERELSQPIEPKLDIKIDTPDNRTLFQKVKDDIFSSLGLSRDDEELFNFLSTNVQSIFSTFGESFSGSIDTQLENNQRLIDDLNKQVEETKTRLDDQLDLKKQGLANDYDLEKKNLAALQEEREKAAEERAELEAKAARRRLLIDSATQVSSLITSAANVIKAESNKGLLGVALAIAGIASFLSIFQKFKATASANVEAQNFRHGENYVKGKGTHYSDEVPANLSVGEKVFKWEHSKALNDAGLMRNEDAVKYALLGKQIERNYNNPFAKQSNQIARLTKEQAKQEVLASMTPKDFEEMLDKAVTKKIVKAIEERPHHFSNTGKGSFIVKDGKYEKSNTFIEP